MVPVSLTKSPSLRAILLTQRLKNIGKDLKKYCLGLIETGSSRLPKEGVINRELLPYQRSIQDHIRLLGISQEVMETLIEDGRIQEAASPVLLHPELNKRNIYVSAEDPTIVTGLIDWQSASVEPAFIYANETPDFATPPPNLEEHVLRWTRRAQDY